MGGLVRVLCLNRSVAGNHLQPVTDSESVPVLADYPGIAQSVGLSPSDRKIQGSIPGANNSAFE